MKIARPEAAPNLHSAGDSCDHQVSAHRDQPCEIEIAVQRERLLDDHDSVASRKTVAEGDTVRIAEVRDIGMGFRSQRMITVDGADVFMTIPGTPNNDAMNASICSAVGPCATRPMLGVAGLPGT